MNENNDQNQAENRPVEAREALGAEFLEYLQSLEWHSVFRIDHIINRLHYFKSAAEELSSRTIDRISRERRTINALARNATQIEPADLVHEVSYQSNQGALETSAGSRLAFKMMPVSFNHALRNLRWLGAEITEDEIHIRIDYKGKIHEVVKGHTPSRVQIAEILNKLGVPKAEFLNLCY